MFFGKRFRNTVELNYMSYASMGPSFAEGTIGIRPLKSWAKVDIGDFQE